jgi:GDP-L-fucose synthase
MISKSSKIYVAGHNGMVGSSVLRKLKNEGYNNLIFKTSKELDLRNQSLVDKFITEEKPDLIIDAAARVGGILANDTYQFDFLMDNMLIQNNLINTAISNRVKKFIFFGSSCIYPRNAIQPINEDQLLTSPLEKTNQWYAIAKISGVKLIESIRNEFNYDYVSLMPTNLYGPNDNYDLKNSHVLPALIRKFHEAKLNNEDVILWGTGKPLREFLHVDDLADATMFFVKNESESHLYNIGSGEEFSISELAILIQKIVNHKGNILYDNNYPDGTPRKLLDSKRINDLGWRPKINLSEGIKNTYHDLLKKESLLRKE